MCCKLAQKYDKVFDLNNLTVVKPEKEVEIKMWINDNGVVIVELSSSRVSRS